MKTGIVFDMDGTLWDSAREVALAWNQVIVRRGMRPLTDQDLARVMGLPMDKLARALFPEMEAQASYDLMDECVLVENDYLEAHGATLYPGVEETLRSLRHSYPLYIVSNCQCGYIEAFLAHYGLGELFEDTQCYGLNRKQKGENIRIVAERNGLDRVIYVGDIEGDYHATVEAGGQFVHAAYGFGVLPEEIAKKVPAIRRFCELPAVIEKICQE
ncbi:MAG: HAD family hydrolase [Lachnospiraceae bacterium]|nr:HAD family hydrolase [Lachnospiraceae bacterium]MDD7178237.1 HAD family hydrolase [bacterium]MDY5516494.1 HAD family hydrolase [Lachnospiraceae bacterium]